MRAQLVLCTTAALMATSACNFPLDVEAWFALTEGPPMWRRSKPGRRNLQRKTKTRNPCFLIGAKARIGIKTEIKIKAWPSRRAGPIHLLRLIPAPAQRKGPARIRTRSDCRRLRAVQGQDLIRSQRIRRTKVMLARGRGTLP